MARQLITLNMQSKETVEVNDNQDRYLSLAAGNEQFGINILKVKEIIEYCELTPIPRMPAFICGALNLRGHVVPVIDLALRLDMAQTEVVQRTCIVIVELTSGVEEEVEVGLLIDAVHQVIDIDQQDIRPAPSFDGAINTDYIHGMGKIGENFIILLNIENMLSLHDLPLLDEFVELRESSESSATSDSEDDALIAEGEQT